MKRRHRKKYNEPAQAHELTFSCYKRFAFLKSVRTCHWLAEAIDAAREKFNFHLWAYVFMPDHAHVMVQRSLVRGKSAVCSLNDRSHTMRLAWPLKNIAGGSAALDPSHPVATMARDLHAMPMGFLRRHHHGNHKAFQNAGGPRISSDPLPARDSPTATTHKTAGGGPENLLALAQALRRVRSFPITGATPKHSFPFRVSCSGFSSATCVSDFVFRYSDL
jgi:REP element-mobilizing transposase RayT